MNHAPAFDGDAVAQMIALFQERADQLKFPDLDASTLKAAAAEIERQRECVEAAAISLDEARQELLVREAALLEKARQAHDYAMIFARNDEQLRAELAEIQLDLAVTRRATGRSAKTRRPRPQSSSPAERLSSESSVVERSSEDETQNRSDRDSVLAGVLQSEAAE